MFHVWTLGGGWHLAHEHDVIVPRSKVPKGAEASREGAEAIPIEVVSTETEAVAEGKQVQEAEEDPCSSSYDS